MDWLGALRVVALYWSFSSGLGVKFFNTPANGIPEEMSQTPLTNKKQGKSGLGTRP
jgi:hypothetical protein